MYDALHMWAAAAAEDPSRASFIARHISEIVRARRSHGSELPAGYIFAAAHNWVVEANNVAVEPLPDAANPDRTPIWSTTNSWRPLRVPWDCLILGVAGWCQPVWQREQPNDDPDVDGIRSVNLISSAIDGRDLFGVEIGLDGQTGFGTDGDNRLVLPASTVLGTRTRPRPLAWRLQRQQVINVRFRNLINLYTSNIGTQIFPTPLVNARVTFYALSTEGPQ